MPVHNYTVDCSWRIGIPFFCFLCRATIIIRVTGPRVYRQSETVHYRFCSSVVRAQNNCKTVVGSVIKILAVCNYPHGRLRKPRSKFITPLMTHPRSSTTLVLYYYIINKTKTLGKNKIIKTVSNAIRAGRVIKTNHTPSGVQYHGFHLILMATRSTTVRFDCARKIVTLPAQIFTRSLYFHVIVGIVVVTGGGEFHATVWAVSSGVRVWFNFIFYTPFLSTSQWPWSISVLFFSINFKMLPKYSIRSFQTRTPP